MELSQNTLRQAVVADKVDNKLDVLNHSVDVIDTIKGLQKQVKNVCSTPQAHDAGELSMTTKACSIRSKLKFLPLPINYNQYQIHRVGLEVLSNKPAYQEIGFVRCILDFPRRVMKFEEDGGTAIVQYHQVHDSLPHSIRVA